MIFSHISDTHLGLVQYGSEERENDIYQSFNQAIDTSIKDHVDFVIFAGDIFHVPNPGGTAIVQMANALKRLKQNNIDSFFILGEHDISRIRTTPIPYVYHNLEFSKYIGQGNPLEYKDVLLVGFDKMRKNEILQMGDKFDKIDSVAKKFVGKKILVLHQGISEFNKFAGELTSSDLPKNFSYYAMGHLHDHEVKSFDILKGPVVYPGSIELTTSEGVKETKKGFYEVDISGEGAQPSWVELDIRPQMSYKIGYEEMVEKTEEICSKISGLAKKPVIELKIHGQEIKNEVIQAQILKLNDLALRCFWKVTADDGSDSTVFSQRPHMIDEELYRLAENALGSEKLANFAIKELLPFLSENKINEASQIVTEKFEKFKEAA